MNNENKFGTLGEKDAGTSPSSQAICRRKQNNVKVYIPGNMSVSS